jgi:hypothetical protein
MGRTSVTQKMPRNELLHERRHKRKAGAHGGAKRPDVSWWQEVKDLLQELREQRKEEK